jgi:hypothetical protein
MQVPGPSPLPFAADVLVSGPDAPSASGLADEDEDGAGFAAYGDVCSFTTVGTGAKVLATFADRKSAAAVETSLGVAKGTHGGDSLRDDNNAPDAGDGAGDGDDGGGGRIIQLAFQPGLSYLINATQEWQIPNPTLQFPAAIRSFLKQLLSPAAAGDVGSTAQSLAAVHATIAGSGSSQQDDAAVAVAAVGVETVLLASDAGAVVSVVNWAEATIPPSTIITLHVNLAAAGFGSDAAGSELGEVVDCASGESLTVTVKKEGADTAIAVVKTKAALANFVVFHRKPPAAPVVAAVTAA